MDFGDSRGYSPLDLVMAARSCSLSEAFEWLEQRVSPKKAEIEVDWDKIAKADDAPPVTPDDNGENGDEQKTEIKPFRSFRRSILL